MNKLKKTLTAITAMAAMLSLASCGPNQVDLKGGSDIKTEQSSAIQQMAETSYKAIEIDAELPFAEPRQLLPIPNSTNVVVSGFAEEDGDVEMVGYITDTNFTEFKKIDLGLEKAGNVNYQTSYIVANDGKIYALLQIIDYGDFELPDYKAPDFDYEDFDYEAMAEAATYTYKIMTIAEDGTVTAENEIKGLEDYVDIEESGTIYIGESFAIGADRVGVSISGGMDNVYITVDGEGNLSEPIDVGTDEYFYPYGTDRDNNFVFMIYEDGKNVIKTIDGSTLQLSPESIPVDDMLYFNSISKGTGEYRVYLSGSTALYGMKDDGSMVEIINWVNSDVTGDYIQGLIPVENGDFLITENNWTTGNSSIYRLTKRDAAEIENVQIINMAVEYANHGLLERVKDFNKENSDYRIKVTDYSEYYEWDEETEKNINTPDKQFKQDIAAGKSYDIICMSDTTGIFNNLSRKGALVDLYTYLDKDSELSKDDLVPTILSMCEKDGKLTSIAPTFYITTLACKTKHCDKENWTIEEFMETCKNLPDGMKPFSDGNTKSDIFYRLILNGSNTFIDYENATCDFNNQNFIDVLEFCNSFSNPGEGDEIDWENATEDEMNEYWEKSEAALRDDKALLYDAYISTPRDYAHLKQGNFGDDITFVGNPSPDGTGTQIYTSNNCGIMESSKCKDACWEFIKEMFSEDSQSSEDIYDFPALKTAFDKKFEEAMSKPYYLDENGKKVEYDDMYYDGVTEVKIDPLTQEECDFIKDFVSNVKPTPFYYNNDVYEIISEESEAYFAGDKTAEQTAEIIQNRVSILISEQS